MFRHLATLDTKREPAGRTVSYCEPLPIIFCQGLTKKTRCGGNKTDKTEETIKSLLEKPPAKICLRCQKELHEGENGFFKSV